MSEIAMRRLSSLL